LLVLKQDRFSCIEAMTKTLSRPPKVNAKRSKRVWGPWVQSRDLQNFFSANLLR
jgi:hypothetical protein